MNYYYNTSNNSRYQSIQHTQLRLFWKLGIIELIYVISIATIWLRIAAVLLVLFMLSFGLKFGCWLVSEDWEAVNKMKAGLYLIVWSFYFIIIVHLSHFFRVMDHVLFSCPMPIFLSDVNSQETLFTARSCDFMQVQNLSKQDSILKVPFVI